VILLMPYTTPQLQGKAWFCQTHDVRLIAISGQERGLIYVPSKGWYPLGVTPPVDAPTVQANTGGESFAGSYYCAYRYKDTFGFVTDLSPITEVTADANTTFDWTVFGSDEERVSKVELFRSTVDQPGTLYKVAELDNPGANQTATYSDSLSDMTLMYSGERLPMTYDNGRPYANRFAPPPPFMRVVVPFGNRYLYAVSTNQLYRNAVFYSEPELPEAVPAENVLYLAVAGDEAITAIAPYRSSVYIFTRKNCYRWLWIGDPSEDYTIVHVAARGALNPRAVAVGNNALYVLDDAGLWAINNVGKHEILADQIADYWVESKIAGDSELPFLVYNPSTRTLRCFVKLATSAANYPDTAICFCDRTKAYWEESYPHWFTHGESAVIESRPVVVASATDGSIYAINQSYARDTVSAFSNILFWLSADVRGPEPWSFAPTYSIPVLLRSVTRGIEYIASQPLACQLASNGLIKGGLIVNGPMSRTPPPGETVTIDGIDYTVIDSGHDSNNNGYIVVDPTPGALDGKVGQSVVVSDGSGGTTEYEIVSVYASRAILTLGLFPETEGLVSAPLVNWVARIGKASSQQFTGTFYTQNLSVIDQFVVSESATSGGVIDWEILSAPILLPVSEGAIMIRMAIVIGLEETDFSEQVSIQLLAADGSIIPAHATLPSGQPIQSTETGFVVDCKDLKSTVVLKAYVSAVGTLAANPVVYVRMYGQQRNARVRIRRFSVILLDNNENQLSPQRS